MHCHTQDRGRDQKRERDPGERMKSCTERDGRERVRERVNVENTETARESERETETDYIQK